MLIKVIKENSLILVLAALGIVLGVTFLYALVHEGGHALMVLLFGGTVIEFQVNFFTHSPHVSYVGISDPLQKALISLAGPILPLILVLPIAFLLRKTKNVFIQGITLLLIGSLLSTLALSVLFALAYGFGWMQLNEDIPKFLFYSGFNPFVVAGIFLILLTAILVFLFKVGRIKNAALSVVNALRKSPKKRYSVLMERVLFVVLMLSLCVAILPNIIRQDNQVSEPLSYHTKIDVDLSSINPNSTIYHTFEVSQPRVYDFSYNLSAQSEVTLRLVNLTAESFVFNNQESVIMYQGSGSVPLAYFTGFALMEGSYALEASSGSKGSLTMYIDSRELDDFDLQYLQLLGEVNDGSFMVDSYLEEGYQLIYHGELALGEEQLLLTVPSSSSERKVSAFAVGDGEVTLCYVADGKTETLLQDFRVTLGRGLPHHRSSGEFRATVTGSAVTLYIYIYEEQQ